MVWTFPPLVVPQIVKPRCGADVATDAAPCISAKISKGTGAEFVQDLVNYAKGLLAPKAEGALLPGFPDWDCPEQNSA